MSRARERATNMNYMALQQGIMRIPLVLGGRTEPSEIQEIQVEGDTVYLGNYFEHGFTWEMLQEGVAEQLGNMYDESIMAGMPPAGGNVLYILTLTEEHYVLFASLQLDESSIGESDSAEAPIAWMKRSAELEEKEVDGLPEEFNAWPYMYPAVAMLQAHFENLLSYYDAPYDFRQEFEGLIVLKAVERLVDEFLKESN